jgi:processive 1,2-diacylglycerol beta-glucosyltransferase
VLGFSTNMHELMAVADLIITKPGGLTSSEALALGKPLFILNPIPGQEAANSDYLLERGAAAKVNRVEDLPFRIAELLPSKQLAGMAKAARALGRPAAAAAVCREVLQRTGAQP